MTSAMCIRFLFVCLFWVNFRENFGRGMSDDEKNSRLYFGGGVGIHVCTCKQCHLRIFT